RALRQNGITVVDGVFERARRELERGWVDEAALSFFARAQKKIADGRYALERVELERAESFFTDAERLVEPELVRPGAAEPPAEATIAIDGRALGAGPVQIDVEPGEHLIVARAPGFLARAELVVVGENGFATELALAPDPGADALERLRARPDSSGAAALARL